MTLHALIPFQRPGTGKSRLAPALTPEERGELAYAMLTDVIAAVREATSVDSVTVATPRGRDERLDAFGVTIVTDDPRSPGLDGGIRSAAAAMPQADDLLVVMADLPCLRPDDVESLVAQPHEVVIARTSDGGTGGLLRRPRQRIATAYGRASADAHHELARAAGASVAVVAVAGFVHDVDVIGDVATLPIDRVGTATRSALVRLGRPAGTTR